MAWVCTRHDAQPPKKVKPDEESSLYHTYTEREADELHVDAAARRERMLDDADVDEEEVKEKQEEADEDTVMQNEGQKQEALEDEWADAGWVSWPWEEEWFWK